MKMKATMKMMRSRKNRSKDHCFPSLFLVFDAKGGEEDSFLAILLYIFSGYNMNKVLSAKCACMNVCCYFISILCMLTKNYLSMSMCSSIIDLCICVHPCMCFMLSMYYSWMMHGKRKITPMLCPH
jgi:hypothetical protein